MVNKQGVFQEESFQVSSVSMYNNEIMVNKQGVFLSKFSLYI